MLRFFGRFFWLSLSLVLLGLLLLSWVQRVDASYRFFFEIFAQILKDLGVALLIANIFSYVLGTKEFSEYMLKKVSDVILSKDFLRKLGPDEQRNVLDLVLRPPKNFADVYSGIADYYKEYIENSMSLFDHNYRAALKVDVDVFHDSEKQVMAARTEVDYTVYRVGEDFEPLTIYSEDSNFKHELTKVVSPNGQAQEFKGEPKGCDSSDPTLKASHTLVLPETFNKASHIAVTRRVVEFGEDHWIHYSYRAVKACHGMILKLRCPDGYTIRDEYIYGARENFVIEKSEDKKTVRISCPMWLSPGFGVNILVAKTEFH